MYVSLSFIGNISKTLKYVLDYLHSTEKGTMAKGVDEAVLVMDRWSWVMGT